jgi:hypothetical protein
MLPSPSRTSYTLAAFSYDVISGARLRCVRWAKVVAAASFSGLRVIRRSLLFVLVEVECAVKLGLF